MSNTVKILAVVGTLAVALGINALVLPADRNAGDYIGFGAQTTGGDADEVLIVTTLDDDGPGSLRWAVENNDQPRTITFDVAGTIALENQIKIGENVTILGDTAPGELTITGSRLQVIGDNVVISGLRIRPGDGHGQAFDSRDGISIGQKGISVSNVVIENNSISYAIDESLTIWSDAHNITISNNIIANALDVSKHSKGGHSMGILIAGNVSKVTIVGNLLANNANRNPAIYGDSVEVEFINNVVYNWSEYGLDISGAQVHALGNVFQAGPDTDIAQGIRPRLGNKTGPLYYFEDNVATISSDVGVSDKPLFKGSKIDVLPSGEVMAYVLGNAGARPTARDLIDTAIIAGVLSGKGRIIDAPEDMFAQTARAKLN